MSSKTQTHYSVLGVEQSATQAEIDAAGRAAIRKHHPDLERVEWKKAAATRRMERINEARETLGDPERRAAYDRQLLEAERAQADQELETEVGKFGAKLGEIVDKRANSGSIGAQLGEAAGRFLGRTLAGMLRKEK